MRHYTYICQFVYLSSRKRKEIFSIGVFINLESHPWRCCLRRWQTATVKAQTSMPVKAFIPWNKSIVSSLPQGSRIEDQRSSLPNEGHLTHSAPTVPDDDFFSLIMRFQSGRLEDQRSTMPLEATRNSTHPTADEEEAPANGQSTGAKDGLVSRLVKGRKWEELVDYGNTVFFRYFWQCVWIQKASLSTWFLSEVCLGQSYLPDIFMCNVKYLWRVEFYYIKDKCRINESGKV